MGYTDITKYSSPWHTPASGVPGVYGQPRKIKSITIHHWGSRGQRFQDVVNFLCDPNRDPRTATSAHYVVEPGKVACIVDPDSAAWHAGNAAGNATSVGIECRPEATAADYATVAELIRDLRKVYGNVPLVRHRDWSATACPGVWDLDKLDRLARGTATPAPKPIVKPAGTTTTKKGTTMDKDDARQLWGYETDADPRDAWRILRDIDAKLDQLLKAKG